MMTAIVKAFLIPRYRYEAIRYWDPALHLTNHNGFFGIVVEWLFGGPGQGDHDRQRALRAARKQIGREEKGMAGLAVWEPGCL